ncbi:MAG: hypothetical protein ACRD5J_18700 [Nitrososphaeraceae archaeon]
MTELTREQIIKRQKYTVKLRDGTIEPDEAEELRQILEIEKQRAISLNDIIAIGAIMFLLYAVIKFLSDGKKNKWL